MARVFTITAASETFKLDATGHGQIAFTVSNTSGRPLRGRAKLVPEDSTQKPWLAITGESERNFPAGGVQQFTVAVTVPPGAKEGRSVFRLDVVSVQNPDEDYAQGPAAAFTIAKQEKPKKFPWWIVAAVVVVAIGVGLWLALRGGVAVPNIVGSTLVEANTALAPLSLKIGTVTNVLTTAAQVDKILVQSPAAGTRASSGSEVNVQVGVAIVTVPVVIGQAYNNAVAALEAADLNVGQITNVNNPGATTGGVVLQSAPPPGNSVQSHTPIALVVQQENVTVPNLVGQPFPAAIAVLTAANLKLGTVTGSIYQLVNGIAQTSVPAAVAGQTPASGSVPIGSSVNLVFPNPSVSINPLLVHQQASHW